jgi:hypothetical protein
VGGSDSGTEGIFVWCTLDAPSNFSQLLKWKTGQPDNLKSEEHCASVTGSSDKPPDNMLLSDLPCASTKKNYMCEVSDYSILYLCTPVYFNFAVKRIRHLHRNKVPNTGLHQGGYLIILRWEFQLLI